MSSQVGDRLPATSVRSTGQEQEYLEGLLTPLFVAGAVAILALGSVTISASAAQAQSAPSFPQFDSRNEPVRLVRAGAAQASRGRVAIVVWGGTTEIQRAAYRGALDLHDAGVPVSFILGPDHDGNVRDALIQIVVDGVTHSDTLAAAGDERLRQAVVAGGRAANNQRLTNRRTR